RPAGSPLRLKLGKSSSGRSLRPESSLPGLQRIPRALAPWVTAEVVPARSWAWSSIARRRGPRSHRARDYALKVHHCQHAVFGYPLIVRTSWHLFRKKVIQWAAGDDDDLVLVIADTCT